MATTLADPPDFSLVLGGPLYQLYRRGRLATPHMELVARRIIVISMLAWLPLLILNLAQGTLLGGDGLRVPFFKDVAVHARFLVALPLLVVAEVVIHKRMRGLAGQFLYRGIIPPQSRDDFDRAIESAMRLRNSLVVELGLLLFVLLAGRAVWSSASTLEAGTWFSPDPATGRLSPAGAWYVWVSTAMFQFILLRWYFRIVIWGMFLWKVSRLELRLIPTHPDGAAGLGFLGEVAHAFAPLLAAHGVLLAGLLANQIFYSGAELTSFRYDMVGILLLSLLIGLGPLLVFMPNLTQARRAGLRDYGRLASDYVGEFHDKWVVGPPPPREQLVGTSDLQSLADLANSFAIIRQMRTAPFDRSAVVVLVVATALPWLPLLLTVIPLDLLLGRVVGMLL